MTTNTRREFLIATAGVWVGSAAGLGQERSPNAKLNIGLIGGRGAQNMVALITNENIVAICDVDELPLAKAATRFPKAKQYRDFRKLIDEAKDLDAVVISTPHHTHAHATARALRAGKHVYCEKPLTHTVWEAREIAQLAAKHKARLSIVPMPTPSVASGAPSNSFNVPLTSCNQLDKRTVQLTLHSKLGQGE